MVRLVDAEKLKRGIRNHCAMPMWCHELVKAEIDETPTVDAVEVIRCKDCKYYVPPEDGDFLGLCTNGKLCVSQCGEVYPEETYFCSYGERRRRSDETD